MAEVTVGAGKVYITKYDSTTGIPLDNTLESTANFIANTKGGITFSYSADKNEIENDMGKIVDTSLKKEKVTVKFGLMSHDAATLKQICSTATVTTTSGTITTEIGGITNQNDDYYIVRFVHTSKAGKITRYTIVGRNEDGFSVPYQNGEAAIIDVTFTGYAKINDKGVLLKIVQQI